MKFNIQEPHALHKFDDKVLYEQPIASGRMYSGSGHDLGKWVLASQGKWEKVDERASFAQSESISFSDDRKSKIKE
jgi:hypothetical protein